MSPTPEEIRSLVGDFAENRIDRRKFLARAVALGLTSSAAGTLLAAASAAPAAAAMKAGSAGGTRPASPGEVAATKPPTTKLTYRPEFDIANLDPAFFASSDDIIIANCILEGLVTYRPGTWDVEHQLAETFEASKNGLQYHFTLKKGIPWQKGYGEVRASDVKFSYERIAGLTKPNLNSPYSGDWSTLETVKVEGPYSGTIILKKPFAPLMHSTLPVGSGLVLPEKAVKKLGKNFSKNLVGSGPYEFSSWVPNQHVVLKRFADYGGASSHLAPKSPFDTIETQVVSSDDTAFAAMETGAIAFAFVGPQIVSQAKSSGSLKVYDKPTLNYLFLSISQKNVPNLNLRRAIRAAIDVPGIIKTAYNGRYQQAYGIIPPSMGIGYWKGAPHYKQNLKQAREYLRKSGEKNVKLSLAVTNDQQDESVAQVVAANLKEIGITVDIQPYDAATFNAIPGNGGGGPHRDLVYSIYVSEPDPYWSFIWFTCAQMGLWNWCDWCDPHFTTLLNKAVATNDSATRDKLYIEAAKIWDKQANIVWVAYPTWFFLAQKWLKPAIRPDGLPYLWATT